jgi:hypothetical protein
VARHADVWNVFGGEALERLFGEAKPLVLNA